MESFQCFLVSDTDVLSPADVRKERMFRANTGVVQAGADAMGFSDLAVVVLQHIGAVAVQHTRSSLLDAGGVFATLQTLASRFHPDQTGCIVLDVGVEDAHGIRATAHAGDHGIRLRAGAASGLEHFRHLHQTFVANHALKIPHHHWIGVWPGYGADDVERVVHVGNPVAHGFVECILQRLAAALHRHHGGSQQLHAVHVGALALDVFAAHIDHAFQPVTGADGGGRHTVLAGAGFCNHARLAHALGEHGLANGVVDFVGAGVVQVFALEKNLRATHLAAHACCVVHGGGASDKVRKFRLEFCEEFGVVLVLGVGVLQFVDGVGQRLGDKAAAVFAKVTAGVGLVVIKHLFQSWKLLVGGAHGGDKLFNFFRVLDAAQRSTVCAGGFNARAHIDGQRFTAWPYRRDAVAHVCRCESTTQDEVSVDVWRKK